MIHRPERLCRLLPRPGDLSDDGRFHDASRVLPHASPNYASAISSEASPDSKLVLVGYDGSPDAASAIGVGAQLLPDARAHIVHLWSPPFPTREVRHRAWSPGASLDELAAALEREGTKEAERVADEGVALATAAGWQAESLIRRSYGEKGFDLARLSEEQQPSSVVVGARGLSGIRAALGSASDGVVHYSPVPVMVVPHPLLEAERHAVAAGPVLVGLDGSAGAEAALKAAKSLFPSRQIEPAAVTSGDDEADTPQGATAELRPVGVMQSARAVGDALSGHAREQNSGLIVVGSRGRSARKELLLGSVAMAVLHHAHRPVLVVPPPA